MTLIAKPFITIFGDEAWCEQIERYCVPNLPMEPTEWVRKTGSDYKLVHVDIDAKKFNENHLMDYGTTILDSPLFHLFIIVESEESYTKTDKSVFTKWIGALRVRSIDTWKLIVVPDDGQKNKFSFSRFSISSKMKTDFNIQKIDNYLIKISENPKERYVQIQTTLRDIVLNIYDDRCFKNEDKIRIQRETRFTPQWSYFDYFALQEELADVYECLSLYEESLTQFDETNFIFEKCLDDFYKGEISPWINRLKDIPFDAVNCLILTNYSDPQKRLDLSQGKLCLADFRAYLLSRQCALLMLLNRYQEIPRLVYTALISFLNECRSLNLKIESSIKNSWIFLASLEALQRFSPIDCEDSLAQDYAALFLLALTSVSKLADDWLVWETQEADWKPIEALAGRLSVLNNDEFGDTPSSRLAGGLRSQHHFQEFHRKIFEEALVVLKHIGRLRSANLVGVQLADRYCRVAKFEDAEPFYLKAIKCLRNENWTHLAMPLRLKLATCQKDQFERDPDKYLKTCIHLAGATFSESGSYFNSNLSLKNQKEHLFYFNELENCLKKRFTKLKTPHVCKLEPLFSIVAVKLLLPTDGYQMIELVLASHLPRNVDVSLFLSGSKFNEMDMSNSKNAILTAAPLTKVDDELSQFPAQYSIPLSDKSSPQLLRTNARRSSEPKKKEFFCQSSIEEDIQTINAGVATHFSPVRNIDNGEDDGSMTLICFPRADAGLKTRKYSISRDITFSSSVPDGLLNFNAKNSPGTTRFIPLYKIVTLTPGRNSLQLRSEECGLFSPRSIETCLFKGGLVLKESISETKMDSSFHDNITLEKLLPVFVPDSEGVTGFVNFTNEMTGSLKIGLLNQTKDLSDVEICVKNERCREVFDSQAVKVDLNVAPIMRSGSQVPLCGPLRYNLESVKDEIYIRVPGLIKRRLPIAHFEEIHINGSLIATSFSKHVVQVDLHKPHGSLNLPVNYIIKSCSLKLHHGIDLCQLLPVVHRSLSSGQFNEKMHFTLLWLIESVDVLKYEQTTLKFTLSMDLNLQIREHTSLNGSIRHEFELNPSRLLS